MYFKVLSNALKGKIGKIWKICRKGFTKKRNKSNQRIEITEKQTQKDTQANEIVPAASRRRNNGEEYNRGRKNGESKKRAKQR